MVLTFLCAYRSLECREQRPAYRFASRPGDEGEDKHHRDAEKDQRGFVFFGVVRQLFDFAAADVYQRYCGQPENFVFHGKEAEAFIAHGRAHVAESALGDGADEQEDDTQQELDVKKYHEKKTGFGIGRAIGGFAANADDCTKNGPEPEEQYQPSYDGVNA